jgi:transposase
MTTLDAVARRKAEASAEELAAAELVRMAKEQGLSLTGPNGLLKQFTSPRFGRGAVRRRRKPAKLHADKAYDTAELRQWVRDRGIAVRIAGKGVDSSQRLGRHRWVIERTISWLTGYHRLNIRYDRKATHFLAFLTLAAALTCFKNLTKRAT